MSKKIALSILILALAALTSGSWAQDNAPITTKDLDIFSWRHIGPWTFSGRITDFAVPQGQSQVYYVATASGGLWKTEDGGLHFKPIFEQYGNMSLGNIDVAPSDPNIVYLGTGEAMHARSTSHGNGVWKSTDAGKTWKFIGLEKSYYYPQDPNPSGKILTLFMSPAKGKLYDNEMDCQRGLFKTTDGGKTWNQVLDLKDRGVGDFVLDPDQSRHHHRLRLQNITGRAWTFIDRQPGNYLYTNHGWGGDLEKADRGSSPEYQNRAGTV